MGGHIFIAPGDITQLAAHAIACSASIHLDGSGSMHPAFRRQFPEFAGWFEDLRREHGGECQVGDTFWMPFRSDVRPHGVVVVAATGGLATAEDKAAIAARSAIDEAAHRLRNEVKLEGRLLIALPAFRIGKGGDRDHQLRAARAHVAAAREALSRHPGVDVAFIVYTPALYRVFLEARGEDLPNSAPVPEIPASLERSLIDGECVLFVGAGLSRGAGLPDWGGLVARMARELGVAPHDKLDFLDLAQWYRQTFGRDGLARLIGETFGDPRLSPRPTLAHYLAMSLPVNHVITTNYDDLLERSLWNLKRYPVAVVDQQDVAGTARSDGVHVVKLHGDAARPGEVVLCRDDYDEFFERRPAMALLLEGLMLNRTFFFLGYSLRDPNFRQVFGRVGRMLREAHRPAFATSFESAGDAGPFLTAQWREKGLNLIEVPGATPEDRERSLLLLLDRLADRVASATPRLMLAPDAEVSPRLKRLRKLLLEVGEELVTLGLADGDAALGATEAGPVSDVLGLLVSQGWRPIAGAGVTLCGLYERLAGLAAEATEKRRLMIEALEAAESEHDVRRVRGQLEELGSGPGTIPE